jgi:bacterioferritin (cytochrome b1)
MYHKTAKYERHHFMQVSKRMALLGAEPEVAPSSTAGGLLGIELGLLDQFREDLAGECAIADVYTGFIQQCFQQQDFGTMSLFQELVQETEEHAHWIQSQLHIAEAMGESDYLQTWM